MCGCFAQAQTRTAGLWFFRLKLQGMDAPGRKRERSRSDYCRRNSYHRQIYLARCAVGNDNNQGWE